MKIEFDLEGGEEVGFDLEMNRNTLAQDLQHAVISAGDEAIRAMQANHPYQDQTYLLSGGMRCKPFGRLTKNIAGAVVTFLAPYAKHVNDGTAKSKPYPFLPIGHTAAEVELVRCVDSALAAFCKRSGE